MFNAHITNLRKLTFLGFEHLQNDGSSNGGDVQLDEECAKVFAMGSDGSHGFDIHKFHDSQQPGLPKYDEKDYIQHRNKSYPHTHVPLRVGSKFMRRRASQPTTTPNSTPCETPREGDASSLSSTPGQPSAPTHTPVPNIRSRTTDADSRGVGLSSITLQEESDTAANSSESECILSDPCGLLSPTDFSPERKVQFNNEDADQFDTEAAPKDRKRRRHHHAHHPKFRKFSLPDDPTQKRRYPYKADGSDFNKHRRVSTQPEDLPLEDQLRDLLDSHRSDAPMAYRRHKMARPSNASLVHIARKEGNELHSSLKKMYDHSPHAIFVELDELFTTNDEREWKETARWIKYEEDVEEGVDRWGKPHVASLSFHSLLNLRKCLEDGLVILDMEEKDLPAIAYRISEQLYKEDLIRDEDKSKIMRILLLRHRHVNEHHDRGFRFSKKHSYTSLQNLHDLDKRKISISEVNKNGRHDLSGHLVNNDNHTIVDVKEELYSASTDDMRKAGNDAAILKRIPADAQGSSILVGEVESMEQPAIAFVRLAEGIRIPSLIEVNIPVRFIFLLLGPKMTNLDYHEVGRSISTLMANHQFHNIAYSASDRKALLSAINEFLDDSIVLPPGDWERQALLPIEEIKAKSEAIKRRKENALKKAAEAKGLIRPAITAEGDDEKKPPYPNPLKRTKRPWGGLINDIRRRFPHYKSDIIDGLNAQCVAAAIFMYFAALSGAIAFGGLMGSKTDDYIGIPETLLCTSAAGMIFAFLSGQPLVVVGVTGPLLLFDESLYQFCISNGIEFLTTRVFISIWLSVIALAVAGFEGSVLVKLFTRFTEDIFSALIVLLYIIESLMKLIAVYERHPLQQTNCLTEILSIILSGSNESTPYPANDLQDDSKSLNFSHGNVSDILMRIVTREAFPPSDNLGPLDQPNTALFCTILTLGTFAIAFYLKMFRNSKFLGRSARRALGDFGVPIAIIVMVLVDYLVPQTYTEKLNVPDGLNPSSSDKRGWFIDPFSPERSVPLWIQFAAVIPAMLVYILLFMETHITELIIDKKERKLKKGSGFHLDIVLVCLVNSISGFFGLPWVCAATVRSIAHVSALTVMSRTHAPGEKPHLIEVKEQRISALTVALLIGLSVFMAPLLRLIPMAVLFGVFLYMGAASTDGIQFFDRIKLLFVPVKHHPQACYVRRVKTWKMHMFTMIQLMCLIVLWVVKSTKASLAFPFFLILMVPVRAHLKCIYSTGELRALDGDQAEGDDDEPDFYAEAPLPG